LTVTCRPLSPLFSSVGSSFGAMSEGWGPLPLCLP
jgi:hypothetical protein